MNTPRRRIIALITTAIIATVVAGVASVQSAVTATATPGLYKAFSIDNGVGPEWTQKLTWKIPTSGIYSVCMTGRFNPTPATVTGIRFGLRLTPPSVAPILTETQKPNNGKTFMSACTNADLEKGDTLTFQARQENVGKWYPRTQVSYSIVRVG